MESVFIELMIILIIGIIVTGVIRYFKQPLIIGYIITGILASPYLLNVVKSKDTITAFAEMGVVLLLFLVGLNLNPKVIKDVGKVSVITGSIQMLVSTIIVFGIMILFKFDVITSLFVGIALAFSSTIIIMKYLTDKRDGETLYGKLAVGLLIMQDIAAMIVLMMITSLSKGGSFLYVFIETIIRGAVLIALLAILSIYVLPKLTKWIAKSQEYLLMFSITWALALAGAFYFMNFSMEVGALLAGVSLAMSAFRHEISSRLRPLRDFFLIMFFILLGSQMVFTNITNYILPIIILSLFTLLLKPLIVIFILSLLGYSRRTNFLTGVMMAQISEFSIIFIALGADLGQISPEVLALVTIIGIISIAGSTYMMLYSKKLYPYFSRYLEFIERKGKKLDDKGVSGSDDYDIILFGYNRIGHDILESIKKMKQKFLVVDYNPDTIVELQKSGIDSKYGDANDLELLNDLNIQKVKMIISTVPDLDTNLLLVGKANTVNEKIITIVVSHQIEESLELYQAGATYVVMPHFLGGKHASMMLEKNGTKLNNFLKDRIYHVENLKNKQNLGFEHPTTNRTSWKQ